MSKTLYWLKFVWYWLKFIWLFWIYFSIIWWWWFIIIDLLELDDKYLNMDSFFRILLIIFWIISILIVYKFHIKNNIKKDVSIEKLKQIFPNITFKSLEEGIASTYMFFDKNK
jgi:hypothetical protein